MSEPCDCRMCVEVRSPDRRIDIDAEIAEIHKMQETFTGTSVCENPQYAPNHVLEFLLYAKQLEEALEKIAVDDPRGPGEFDCIQIARAALKQSPDSPETPPKQKGAP